MGVSYSSLSAIGMYIPRDKLTTWSEQPSCGHSDDARKGKFCSDCGIKVEVNKVEDETLIGGEMDSILASYGLNGFPVYKGDYDVQGWVVGYCLHAHEYTEKIEEALMPDSADLEKLISDFVKDKNINITVKIKFITHLHCSY